MPENKNKEYLLALWALTAVVIAYVVIPLPALLFGEEYAYAARAGASVIGTLAGVGIMLGGARWLAGSWHDAFGFLKLNRFRWQSAVRALWLAPALLLAAGALTGAWMLAGAKLGVEFTLPASTRVMSEGPMATRLVLAFSAVCIAPVFEELVFRRAFFGAIAAKCPANLAAWLTALGFAAMHLSLLQLPGIALLGWAWQRVVLKDDSIWSSAMVHAVNNLIAVGMVFLVQNTEFSGEMWT